MKYIVTGFAVLAALLQGGFPDAVWSIFGIAAAAYLCFRWKKHLPKPIVVSMSAMILIYILSALYHGITYESMAAAGKLLVVGLLLLSLYNMEIDVHETLFVSGMVVAAIGFVTFCEIIHWDGAVASRRLQSVFQYSNATGLFLGLSAFIIQQDAKRRPYAIFLETALVLTQSVGALLIYIAGWAIFLFKNRHTRFAPVFFGFAASLVSAGVIYAVVFVFRIPQLAIVLPAALLAFRKTLQNAVMTLSDHKNIARVGCCIGAAAVVAVLAMRGLTPAATYLERLIQISDGAKAIATNPLGIGPGAWQFYYQEYQSAPYNAAIMHSGYVAVGLDAGLITLIPLVFFLVYWFKSQKWDDICVCIIMILLHAVMDISFSFLSIVFVLTMLLAQTIPHAFPQTLPLTTPHTAHVSSPKVRRSSVGAKQKKQTLLKAVPTPLPVYIRLLPIIPLVIFMVVFVSSAMKNVAAWSANSGNAVTAATQLDKRLIRSDMEACLTQMRLFLDTGEHARLDAVFISMSKPNADAYSIMAQSYLQRGQYRDAAELALICAERSPHSRAGYLLVEEAASQLDEDTRLDFIEKTIMLETSIKENRLFAYIRKIEGGDGN